MNPRKLIKTGVVLGEIMLAGFLFFTILDFFSGVNPAAVQPSLASEAGGSNLSKMMPALAADEGAEPAITDSTQPGLPEVSGRRDASSLDSPAGQPETVSVDCGPPEDWVVYHVDEGDSLGSLGQELGIEAAVLQQANCLGESQVIVSGMALFVPQVPQEKITVNNVLPTPEEQNSPPASKPVSTQEEPVAANPEPTQPAANEESVSETTTEPTTEAASDIAEVDARSITSERTGDYVSNPGMGWQYRGGTFPLAYPEETVAYSQRNLISWSTLNPAEGVYNWGPLDSQLNKAVGQGKQFSFRVYTMIGEYFGGHQVPQWVIQEGAEILSTGEPNYANCTYQQEWGKFVNALAARYDGNPNIAYIDISGYGNFNEWSWQDSQTQWDDVWADNYASGTAGPGTMSTLDSYARRVLADMFVGGAYSGHECVDANHVTQTYNYNYPGFKSTQLVLPYAGLIQSTQYVFTKTKNVGFRHDCLGRESSTDIVSRLGKEIAAIWPNAPVIYETCKPDQYSTENAEYLINNTHPTLIHDVNLDLSADQILDLVEPLGYQYALNSLRYSTRARVGGDLYVKMTWQNDGIAPAYPRMGQNFELHVYLINDKNQRAADIVVPANVASWMPAATINGTPPVYTVEAYVSIPEDIAPGIYNLRYAIVNTRNGEPIWLPGSPIISNRMSGIIIGE